MKGILITCMFMAFPLVAQNEAVLFYEYVKGLEKRVKEKGFKVQDEEAKLKKILSILEKYNTDIEYENKIMEMRARRERDHKNKIKIKNIYNNILIPNQASDFRNFKNIDNIEHYFVAIENWFNSGSSKTKEKDEIKKYLSYCFLNGFRPYDKIATHNKEEPPKPHIEYVISDYSFFNYVLRILDLLKEHKLSTESKKLLKFLITKQSRYGRGFNNQYMELRYFINDRVKKNIHSDPELEKAFFKAFENFHESAFRRGSHTILEKAFIDKYPFLHVEDNLKFTKIMKTPIANISEKQSWDLRMLTLSSENREIYLDKAVDLVLHESFSLENKAHLRFLDGIGSQNLYLMKGHLSNKSLDKIMQAFPEISPEKQIVLIQLSLFAKDKKYAKKNLAQNGHSFFAPP